MRSMSHIVADFSSNKALKYLLYFPKTNTNECGQAT